MRYLRILLVLPMLLLTHTLSAQFQYDKAVKAHDFEGVTIDGRPYHLFESPAERILICFWSVDCDYCHEFLKKLRRHTCLKHDYELVTFALGESQEAVQKEVKKLRLPGWHFYDTQGWDSQPFLEYDVNITPTIVLVDKEKNMVGEAYDWDEFKELMNKSKELNKED